MKTVLQVFISAILLALFPCMVQAQVKRTMTFLNSYYGPSCTSAIDRYYLGMEVDNIEGRDEKVWKENDLILARYVYRGQQSYDTFDSLLYWQRDGYITRIHMGWYHYTATLANEPVSQEQAFAHVRRLGMQTYEILVDAYKKPTTSKCSFETLNTTTLWSMLHDEEGDIEVAIWKTKQMRVTLKVGIRYAGSGSSHQQYLFRGTVDFELLDTTGMPKKAVARYTDSLKTNPKMPEYYYGRGLAYVQQKQYKDALIDLDRATSIDSTYRSPYFARAYCYRQLEKQHAAILEYNYYLRLDTASRFGYYNRGETWFEMKNYDAAISDYRESFRRGYEWGRMAIGWTYTIAGKYDSAIITNKDFLDHITDLSQYRYSGTAKFNTAVTYLYMGDSAKASTAYAELFKSMQDYPTIYREEVEWADDDIIDGLAASRIQPTLGREILRQYFALTDQEIDTRLREARTK